MGDFLNIDELWGPMVIASPQEVTTYLENYKVSEQMMERLLFLRAKFYELSGLPVLANQVYDSVISNSHDGSAIGMAYLAKALHVISKKTTAKKEQEVRSYFNRALTCDLQPSLRGRILFHYAMYLMFILKKETESGNLLKAVLKEDAPSFIKGIALQHIAAAEQEREDYFNAVEHYGHALKEQLSQNGRAQILSNLGRIYFHGYEDKQSAFEYWLEAEKWFDKKKIDYDKDDHDDCFFGLAECYFNNDEIERAKQYYGRVIESHNENTKNYVEAEKRLKEL